MDHLTRREFISDDRRVHETHDILAETGRVGKTDHVHPNDPRAATFK